MIRKFLALLISGLIFLSSCGNPKTIDGVYYDTYGLLSAPEIKDPNIQYSLIIGNVVWAVILAESIIAPVYFLGFSIYEPVGKKSIK